MRAQFEKVDTPDDASWRFFHRQLDALPFEWHFHPEYELTLTVNSQGRRYVGDHVGEYHGGDLVLIGPNLPHSWQSVTRPDPGRPHTAFVLWFRQDWVDRLIADFPEYRGLRPLLAGAARGLDFAGGVPDDLMPTFEALIDAAPRQRLAGLLSILDRLLDWPAEPLASPAFAAEGPAPDQQVQLGRVLERIHRDFAEPLTLDDLARAAYMSPSTFSRFFRRHMKQSFHHYLTQVRLGHASSELIASERPVALIAERAGFRNLANFNRLFRKYRGDTPSGFRRAFAGAA